MINFSSSVLLSDLARRAGGRGLASADTRTPQAKDISQQNPNIQLRPVFWLFTSRIVLSSRTS